MIAVISPAKTLDFEYSRIIGPVTTPVFLDEAEKVNKALRRKSRKKLMELQGISKALAELNYHRNQEWNPDHDKNTRQAVLAFKGDVYQGLQADEWGEKEISAASGKLWILSGLYGLLRPTDKIAPYRLEMGTSLKIGRRDNLYLFWKDKLAAFFKENIAPGELIVNLASHEYFKAIETAKLPNPVLHIEFKDYSGDEFKVISFFAKKARGLMADYIVRNNLDNPAALKLFDGDGYYYDDKSSSGSLYVFLREKRG